VSITKGFLKKSIELVVKLLISVEFVKLIVELAVSGIMLDVLMTNVIFVAGFVELLVSSRFVVLTAVSVGLLEEVVTI